MLIAQNMLQGARGGVPREVCNGSRLHTEAAAVPDQKSLAHTRAHSSRFGDGCGENLGGGAAAGLNVPISYGYQGI